MRAKDCDKDSASAEELRAIVDELHCQLRNEQRENARLREAAMRDLHELRALREGLHRLLLAVAAPGGAKPPRSVDVS